MALEISKIDFSPYARLIRRLAGESAAVIILDHDGDVLWLDPALEREWGNSALAVARRIIPANPVSNIWQDKVAENHGLIGVNLGGLPGHPLGWLLVLINSAELEIFKDGSHDQALDDIAVLLGNALKSSLEREEMTAGLMSHDNELNFIYGTDGYLDGQNSIAEGMENIVLECCHHMDMDAAAILAPSQNIWASHLEVVVDTAQNWEKKLREFAEDVLAQFIATGHKTQVKQCLLGDEIVAGHTYVLVSPIKSRNGNPIGVFILLRGAGKKGFSQSEEKIGEVMANRIRKYMVAGLDPLTGLLDRLGFEAQVETVLSRFKENLGICTLAKIDIDSFELINDAYSVIGGDQVLKQLAALIKNHLRDDAVVARIGGDDFGIILHGFDPERAYDVIERLRKKIVESHFEYGQKLISISVSIGLLDLGQSLGSLTWVESALDVACQNAKENGGNRIQLYEADNSELTQRLGEISFAGKIDAALEEGRFELYCQPLVPLWGGNFHYEILLRLKSENGEIYLPDLFMGAAERYNRLPNIDRWVVKTALETLGKWAKVLQNHDLCWGINLTGQSLAEDSFMQFVEEQVRAIDFPANWIYFEITESVAIRNFKQVQDFVSRIKALGCNFALDDFGTGYSSYSYLKNLPVSYLKIDGSFIRNLNNDPFNQLTVQSINQLAHYLGVKTVAEYVENEEIGQIIRKIGIDYAQGYAYGPPQQLQQFLAGLSG